MCKAVGSILRTGRKEKEKGNYSLGQLSTKHLSNKGLIPRIHKAFSKLKEKQPH
jgi:hypothetical protein